MRSQYRYALAGFTAVALLTAGCSSSSSSSSSGSSVNWSNETTAAAGGGLNALIAAAKAEGTLNVIALPPTWANYGTIIADFEKTYGIKINSALPDGSSQQEVNAIKAENGSPKAPDVVDVGLAVAVANTNLFAPYEVSTWSDIPSPQKDRPPADAPRHAGLRRKSRSGCTAWPPTAFTPATRTWLTSDT